MPIGLAADSSGFIYVVDSGHHCIHKFTADGQRIITWGEKGPGNSQLDSLRESRSALTATSMLLIR